MANAGSDHKTHRRFIASRPLTFADLDTATGYLTGEQMRAKRRRFFAPMTIAEAGQAVRLFTERLGEQFSVPDLKAQNCLRPLAVDEPSPQAAKPHLRPELVLAPAWDAKCSPQHGGAFFPAGGAPEWVEDDETWHIAFPAGGQADWEFAFLPGPSKQAAAKALLRPVLSIPIWATAS